MPAGRTKQDASGLGPRTVSGALVVELRRRILDGRLAAGLQLRQDALAEEFNVSRIPVREALFQLEAEGLVRLTPQRGAAVSEFSPAGVQEAFELRALLEPRLLRDSAPNLTAADYIEIHATLEAYSAALRDQDTSRWGELNRQFHILLYRRAGKPKTEGIVAGLLQECDRYTRLQLSADAAALARADIEHRALVRLCEAGDIEAACTLLEAHVAHVGQSLGQLLATGPLSLSPVALA